MAVNICYWRYENKEAIYMSQKLLVERGSKLSLQYSLRVHSHVGNSHRKRSVNLSWDLKKMFSTASCCKKNLEDWQRVPRYSVSLPLRLGAMASNMSLWVESPCHRSTGFKGFLLVLACCKAQLICSLSVLLCQVVHIALAMWTTPEIWVQSPSVVTCIWYGDNTR